MLDRRLDIAKLLTLVSPHQEHSRLDSMRFAHRYGGSHFFSGDTALHGIQNALRTALGTNPYAEASHFRPRFDNLRINPTGPRNALERHFQSSPLQFACVLKEPAVVNGENVIGHPRHLGLVSTNQPLEFVGHRRRLPAAMCLAEYFVAAPAAMVGAAASGDK